MKTSILLEIWASWTVSLGSYAVRFQCSYSWECRFSHK